MCRTHKSYIKHVTELQAAGRRICSDPAGINTAVLIFQSDLVLPISVQILHISHILPVSTPLFQQISIYKIPSPSRSTLRPIRISITPPQISAFDWYLLPKILPIFTPMAEQTKVTTPINDTAGIIFT